MLTATFPAAPSAFGRRVAPLAVHGLLVLSGFAGLGYQIVWIRMLAVGVGHEAVAMLSVVAAFFAGLTLGAALFSGPVARTARPGHWYAGLEIAIGVWALALIWAIPAANALLADVMGPQPDATQRWLATFLGPMLLLAPATVAMGATLPAAERLHARWRGRGPRSGQARSGEARSVGGLYAANALGAALGAVATLGLLGPAVGFNGALAIFALVNFACAALTLRGPAAGETAATPAPPPDAPPPDAPPSDAPPSDAPPREAACLSRRAALAALFATGLLGIGYEVAVARALAHTLESTVYSFAAVVVVYLVGATVGGVAWQAVAARARLRPAAMTLMAILAALGLLGALAALNAAALYGALRAWLGTGAFAGWGAEALTATIVFLPCAVVMGALFPVLAEAARGRSGGLGGAFAVNTLGAAAAPALVGVASTPALGVIATLGALSAGYGLLAAALYAGPPRRRAALALAAPAAVALALAPQRLQLVDAAPGETVHAYDEGVATTAIVLEASAGGARRLVVDGRFGMGGDATEAMDRLQGHIPLLLHPKPRDALFLGLGAGATYAAAAAHPDLQAVAVEISQPVIDALPAFRGPATDILGAPALRVLAGDARRFVRATPARYDVIVADTFHPARDGAAMLYTREHFAAVRDRLADGGLFAQWLPLHQFDMASLRSVAATFRTVFPDATLHMANASLVTPLIALIGGRDAAPMTLDALANRAADGPKREALAALGLGNALDLLGAQIADADSLAAFADGAPLNTDAHPVVLFGAPATVYGGLGPAGERLLALIDAMDADPGRMFDAQPTERDALFAERLAAYVAARDAFLRLGANVSVSGDANIDAQRLAPHLLRIAGISPDYAPVQRPLLGLVEALARTEPARAASLLREVAPLAPRERARVAALARRLPPPR